MTDGEVAHLFKTKNDEYRRNDRIGKIHHPRRDIAAMLMIHEIVDGTSDMVASAEHDVIYFDCSVSDLADAGVTQEQVVDLIRYGVTVEDENLIMYV